MIMKRLISIMKRLKSIMKRLIDDNERDENDACETETDRLRTSGFAYRFVRPNNKSATRTHKKREDE